MTDTDILYRAILDAPEDDTLRLVYADALEEGGDPRRAAFVREQVELNRVPEYDPLWVRVRARGRSFDPQWVADLDLPEGIDWTMPPFRRGLPGAIQARDAATFVAHADDLFTRYPIEALELVAIRPQDTREFPACPWLERLTTLSLVQGAGGPTVQQLLASPHFTRLRELRVGSQMTTSATVSAIMGSRVFKQLTGLGVQSDQRDGRFAGALARLTSPPALETLNLSGNRLGAPALEALVASEAVAAVHEFDLSDNNLGAVGVSVLAGGALPSLRALRLLRTWPHDDGVGALVEARFFPELRSLALGGNNLGASAAFTIANAPAAKLELRVLDLSENPIGDRGAISLADSGRLAHLIQLDLAETRLGDAGADALADSPHLGELLHLNLSGNTISAVAADRLRARFGPRVFL